MAGAKTVEVRVGYKNIRRLQVGDRLLLNDQYRYLIRRIGRYDDFETLLAHEDPAAIAPDVPPAQLLEKIGRDFNLAAFCVQARRGRSSQSPLAKNSESCYDCTTTNNTNRVQSFQEVIPQ